MLAYNLLVTFHGNQRGHAEQEIMERMKDLGVYVEKIDLCEVEGVFLLQVGGDAKVLVAQLKRVCDENPSQFIYTYHWVPIERWVPSNKREIIDAATELGRGIGEDETWMMHLHKRHFEEHHDDLIAQLTGPLNRGRVNLEDPDKIVAVEILGRNTGLSLLNRHELLDVNKVRLAAGAGTI
ncbi:MAG: THUMP domain-containing protein [Methanomassiliicoccales archaeon]|nr:THUMP domain-containing protein [Methanomassiliicoccales archaeon]